MGVPGGPVVAAAGAGPVEGILNDRQFESGLLIEAAHAAGSAWMPPEEGSVFGEV